MVGNLLPILIPVLAQSTAFQVHLCQDTVSLTFLICRLNVLAPLPDLARVGQKYSDQWQVDHLKDPRALVPESIMPPYAFLADKKLNFDMIEDRLKTERFVGVPYTDEMIANAKKHIYAQADPDNKGFDYYDSLMAEYEAAAGRENTVQARDYDGDPTMITEMDALVAYLQMTGTLVDFLTYEADDLSNRR